MYLAKTWLTAMLLCSVAVSAMRENLFAQTWQPVRPVDNANSPPNDWQQRAPSRRSKRNGSRRSSRSTRRYKLL